MENLAINEEWRPVVGYEGYYEVSNYGNVRSVPRFRNKGTLLKPSLDSHGYFMADLWKNNQRQLSIDACSILYCCNHNGVRSLPGGFQWKYKDSDKVIQSMSSIAQFDLDGNRIAVFNTIADAARNTGIRGELIRRCIIDSSKTAGGYKWNKI